MNSFQLILDSRYRDKKNYPLVADFVSVINPQPSDNNSNQIYFEENLEGLAFQWIGGSSPTLSGKVQQIISSNSFLIDANQAVNIQNYYTGLLFTFVSTGETSLILSYDGTANVVLLDTSPSTTALSNIQTGNNGYTITNNSNSFGNNLFPLGLNIFYAVTTSTYVDTVYLQTGPSSQLYIQDVTKNWILPISAYVGDFRMIQTASPFPSFDLSDIFQIRYTGHLSTFLTSQSSRVGTVLSYSIVNDTFASSVTLTPGTVLYTAFDASSLPVQFIVTSVDTTRGTAALSLNDPGNQVSTSVSGTVLDLFQLVSSVYQPTGLTVSLQITTQYLVVPFTRGVQNFLRNLDRSSTNTKTYLYYPYFPPTGSSLQGQTIFERSYFIYSKFFVGSENVFVYATSFLVHIPDALVPAAVWMEVLPQKKITCGINVPLMSYQSPVCYEIRLVSLILPNQPVKGYSVLPSYFPFFFIELYQNQGIYSNQQVMYSNNPNTKKAVFFCPNGNPLNPTTSSFVIVRSWQRNIIKWVPTEDIYFRVSLPDGTTLNYEFEDSITNVVIQPSEIQPLVVIEDENSISRFTRNNITASFYFTMAPVSSS